MTPLWLLHKRKTENADKQQRLPLHKGAFNFNQPLTGYLKPIDSSTTLGMTVVVSLEMTVVVSLGMTRG